MENIDYSRMCPTSIKLSRLKEACERLEAKLSYAMWVYNAAAEYFMTSKAPLDVEKAFVRYPDEKMDDLVLACLKGDNSDAGIIKKMRRKLMAANA